MKGTKAYVERASSRFGWDYLYISNGSFVAAALILGYSMIGTPKGNPMFAIDYAKRSMR